MRLLLIFFFGLSVLLLYADDAPLIIKHADSFEYMDKNGVKHQKLIGNVEIEHKNVDAFADTVIHYQREDKIDFIGSVDFRSKDEFLKADRVIYFKRDSSLKAYGNIVISNEKGSSLIKGGLAEYTSSLKESKIWDKPSLTRIDSTEKDSMIITAKVLRHNSEIKVAFAEDSVDIKQGDMTAKCDFAKYYKEEGMVYLTKNPLAWYQENRLKGDTIKLFLQNDDLERIVVIGNAEGYMFEKDSIHEDSAEVSLLYGDTLTAYIAEGSIERIVVKNNAIGISYLKSDTLNKNRLSGKYLEMFFSDNSIDSTHVYKNARVLYFEKSDGKKERNETSGDTLNIYFKEKFISTIVAKGGVQGVYFIE